MKTVAVGIGALARVSTTIYVDVADDASAIDIERAARIKANTGDYVWDYEGVLDDGERLSPEWMFYIGDTVAENIE